MYGIDVIWEYSAVGVHLAGTFYCSVACSGHAGATLCQPWKQHLKLCFVGMKLLMMSFWMKCLDGPW